MPETQSPQLEILAFRAPADLVEKIMAVARDEGITKSDVVRRAVLRDLRKAEAA